MEKTIKPRAKSLNDLLMRKGHAVHKDARRPARSNAKSKLRQEY
jgi:hypothetical protein